MFHFSVQRDESFKVFNATDVCMGDILGTIVVEFVY